MSAAAVDSTLRRWRTSDDSIVVTTPGENAPANYLLHHLAAIRLAREAGVLRGGGAITLRRALTAEAVAQSYLGDALSSGHMRVPLADRFARLHSTNNRKVHDYYDNLGLYVIDGTGDVWQGFGDGLLRWYGPTWVHALRASTTSVRELLLVWWVSADAGPLPPSLARWAATLEPHGDPQATVTAWCAARDGREAYAALRMPALLLIPVPISATWSVQSPQADRLGLHGRRQFPQVREPGGHDPQLGPREIEQLTARAAWPAWMVPDSVRAPAGAKAPGSHPVVASVIFDQAPDPDASYVGLVLRLGVATLRHGSGGGSGPLIGAGYGCFDALPAKRLSVDAVLMPSLGNAKRDLLSLGVGWRLALPPASGRLGDAAAILGSTRVEVGRAWGLNAADRSQGLRLGLGVESPVLGAGFTNAGIAARFAYQWMWLERELRGFSAELVVH